jgi:hypothetical protein
MEAASYRQKVVELAILVNNLLALGAANTAVGVNQLGHRPGNRNFFDGYRGKYEKDRAVF